MNTHFNIQCSDYLIGLKYKPCAEYKRMDMKSILNNMKLNKPLLKFNRHKKTQQKYNKLVNQCKQYKKNATKKQCSLDEYIRYSGANK